MCNLSVESYEGKDTYHALLVRLEKRFTGLGQANLRTFPTSNNATFGRLSPRDVQLGVRVTF